MSLPDSPLIRTDVLDRRSEPWVVAVSLCAACLCPIGTVGESGPVLRTMLALAAVGLLWRLWWHTGWLGGVRRVRRGVWSPDGYWTLDFADGGTAEARLTSATRCVGPIVLLAWRTDRGRAYVLVTGALRAGTEFRRLVARLRLEGSEAGRSVAAVEPAA